MTTPSERLRALHFQGRVSIDKCFPCWQPWPCDTIKALDRLEKLYGELLAVRPSRGQLIMRLKAADALAEAVKASKARLGGDVTNALRAYREAGQ